MNDQFMPGVAEQLGSYVYLLTDPRNTEIFYVGKGKGERCFAHVAEARLTVADITPEYEKLSRIRDIEQSGHTVGIEILCHGLTEDESLRIEAVAIDLLRLQLTNRVSGQGCRRLPVAEVNACFANPVEIDPDHSVVLVNLRQSYLPGMSDVELYEHTRKWWRIAQWRLQVGSPGTPIWAFAVAFGVVRGVYRITGWEQSTAADIAVDSRRAGRWGFIGTRDLEMERRYLGGDVSRYTTSQNPLRFLLALRTMLPDKLERADEIKRPSPHQPVADGLQVRQNS